jgi:hypothetical protein
MNSVTVFAGTETLIANAAGAWAMPATGSMSRMKLKLRLFVEGGVDRTREIGDEQGVAVGG